MKIDIVRLSLVVLLLGLLGASQVIDVNQEIICNPENSEDCYPKVFIPSSEWQLIRDNQDIPPGLHVRLNIETLKKEAKLMDPEDQDTSNAIIVAEDEVRDRSDEVQEEFDSSQKEQIRQKVAEFKKAHNKPKVDSEELNNFQNTIDEVVYYDGDKDRLKIALETLEDLSHDIELGVGLTQNSQVFASFLDMISNNIGEVYEEIIYRIMGSSLRNNPEAIKNTLEGQSSTFVETLFRKLKTSSDVIQKRILGIIQSLNQDLQFRTYFYNHSGVTKLVETFTSLGPQAKERLINIFEDLHMISETQASERRADEPNSADGQFSQMLQTILAENRGDNKEQNKVFFRRLVEVHENNGHLQVNQDFLKWLSKEVTTKPTERDNTSDDVQFHDEMLHARHVVFGNPNAMRKALADEL